MSPARVPRFAWLCFIVLGISFAAYALAQGTPTSATALGDPERVITPAAKHAPAPTLTPAKPANPMVTEMRAVLETERVQFANLFARFRVAPDGAAALAVQREIEQLKVGTEISLLRIQADYARRAGRISQAAELEKVITELQAPLARVAPASSNGPEPASR